VQEPSLVGPVRVSLYAFPHSTWQWRQIHSPKLRVRLWTMSRILSPFFWSCWPAPLLLHTRGTMSAIPHNGIPEIWKSWRIFVESLIWAYSTEVSLSSAFGFFNFILSIPLTSWPCKLWDENHNNNIWYEGIKLRSQNENSQDIAAGIACNLYSVQ